MPTDIPRSNQIALGVMGEKINNIEKLVAKTNKDLQVFIKKADDTYATKSSLLDTKEDVAKLRGSFEWITRLVIGAVILALLGLILSPSILMP